MNKSLKKKKKGFTLVEVIIVLAIIAIIAAIAIPNLTKVRQESKIKADKQSMETIERTINMLITDGTIKHDVGSITFSFNGNKIKDIKIGTNAATSTGDVFDYFKDVKAPQQEGMKSYVVTVDSNGEVKAQTSSATN